MRDERGFTLIEMMVSAAVFLVVLAAILTMVQVATKNQRKVAARVAANQRARPVLQRLMDQMHSGCIAPGAAPVLEGSDGSTMFFMSKSGSAVSPTPDKYGITLSGTTLSQSVYPATGGAPPIWTFSPTPSSTRILLTNVGQGSVGGTTVPVFRYYKYNSGQLSTTPQTTPLTPETAAEVVHVKVAFATSPLNSPGPDSKAPITLADSATLRLEPASEDTSEVNLPCV